MDSSERKNAGVMHIDQNDIEDTLKEETFNNTSNRNIEVNIFVVKKCLYSLE